MRPAERFLSDEQLVQTLFFVVLALFASSVPAQSDTWYHLRSGLEMWRTRAPLVTEPFSYTAHGAPLGNHWWLSQLLFYAVYAIGGAKGLSVFLGGCAFAAVAVSYRLTRKGNYSDVILLPLLILATAPAWSARPQLISLLLLALTAHLVVADRVRWLPLLCVVWANAHALVIFGVAVAAVTAIEALVVSRAYARRDVAMAILCALSPTISPLGWQYWPRVLATVSVSKALEVSEYRPPFAPTDFPFWILTALLAWLTLAQRHTFVSRPRTDRLLVATAWVLWLAAATAARNVAFFAIIGVPAVARLLHAQAPVSARPPRPAGWPAFVLVALLMAFGSTVVVTRWRNNGVAIGWVPMSTALIQAVRTCPDPIFNTMWDGGSLMWAVPERRVFIDGRMEAYPLELLRRSQQADVNGDYITLFRDYHIRCAIVRVPSRLHEQLTNDTSMTLTYSDRDHAVYRSVDFAIP